MIRRKDDRYMAKGHTNYYGQPRECVYLKTTEVSKENHWDDFDRFFREEIRRE